MEPRTAMAYWQNGKCIVHVSSQSQSFITPALAGMIGIPPTDLVVIAEYCGGGFGSKGGAYPLQALPALLSKKINRPVMMRISRAEEYYHGSARLGFQGQVKLGFAEDGKLLAADLYIVQENGACNSFWDFRNAADGLSMLYQPEAMRWRGVPVYANSPIRSAQRGPGYNQMSHIMEPLLDKAARELKIDRLAIRLRNAPGLNAPFGAQRTPVSSCYLKEALDKGAEIFNWQERSRAMASAKAARSRPSRVGQAFHPAGFCRVRRPAAHPAHGQGAHPHRRRQPRHLLAFEHLAHRGRGAEGRLGRRGSSSAATPAATCRGTSASSAATPISRWRAPTIVAAHRCA